MHSEWHMRLLVDGGLLLPLTRPVSDSSTTFGEESASKPFTCLRPEDMGDGSHWQACGTSTGRFCQLARSILMERATVPEAFLVRPTKRLRAAAGSPRATVHPMIA